MRAIPRSTAESWSSTRPGRQDRVGHHVPDEEVVVGRIRGQAAVLVCRDCEAAGLRSGVIYRVGRADERHGGDPEVLLTPEYGRSVPVSAVGLVQHWWGGSRMRRSRSSSGDRRSRREAIRSPLPWTAPWQRRVAFSQCPACGHDVPPKCLQ